MDLPINFTKQPVKVNKFVRITLYGIPCIYFVLFILYTIFNIDQNFWDFGHDYYAAKAFLLGLNPYNTDVLFKLGGVDQRLPFVYTPISLLFFAPFTLLSYETAPLIILGFYVFVLVGTFIYFSHYLLSSIKQFGPFYLFFAVLAFNGAINKSIHVGNVASLETALVFMALMCWLKGRHIFFMILIFAASIFKLTPLFFLSLIFFDKTPRWRSAAVLFVTFLFVLEISFQVVLSNVSMSFSEWLVFELTSVGGCEPLVKGFNNPSVFCFMKELIANVDSFSMQNALTTIIFAFWVIIILFFTIRAGFYLVRENHIEARTDLAVLALLCYALLMPRFQDYSWVLLIPAVFRVIIVSEYATTVGPLTIFCLLPQRADTFPGLNYFFTLIFTYSPILVVFGAWILLVYSIIKRRSHDISTKS
jgi:hypothetical protein